MTALAPSRNSFYRHIEWDMETGIPLFWVEVPYDGPWAEVKKGREAQAQATQQQMDIGKQNQATRNEQLAKTEPDIEALDVKPGELSSAARSQLGADLGQIGTTYNNAGQVGLKAIAQRGMGGPSGATASLANSLAMQRARDENAAYNTAQQTSHQDMLNAINARTGLQTIYNPEPAYQGASEAAFRQAQSGSLLGDIGKGLTTAASLAATGAGIHG